MKTKILILLLLGSSLSSPLFAQNTYLQVLFPWLSFKEVVDKKVKKVTRAVMNEDNSGVDRYHIVEFDAQGRPVKETTTGGATAGIMTISYDETSMVRSITYSFSIDNSITLDSFVYNAETNILSCYRNYNGWMREDFVMNNNKRIIAVNSYIAEVEKDEALSATTKWTATESIKVEYNETNHTIAVSTADFSSTFYYSAEGTLLKYVTVNNLYSITETTENTFDQNGLQVKSEIFQDDALIETSFITYEYF